MLRYVRRKEREWVSNCVWKKWYREMKCRGKQQLNNYIHCNLLTNRIHITVVFCCWSIGPADPIFSLNLRFISLAAGRSIFRSLTPFTEKITYGKVFSKLQQRLCYLFVDDDAPVCARSHIWQRTTIASTQYFSKYGPFNLSIPAML